jgi:phage/plasmid-like protein (TIGR03299 family)
LIRAIKLGQNREAIMAHNIEGNYAFFNTTPAWHGLGQVLTDAPTPAEAWNMAYPFTLHQCAGAYKVTDPETGAEVYGDAPEHSAIVRSDGKVLGMHSDSYGLVQPAEVFQRYAPLIESGLVTLESGGSLNGGRKLWVLGKVTGADADIVPGDPIRGYVLFQESFDGSCRSGAGLTSVRVVCANTLAMAQKDVTFQTKHTRHVNQRLDAYRDEIARVLAGFHAQVSDLRALAARKVSRNSQEVYIREVISPESLQLRADGAEVSSRMENKVQRVIELLDTQKGLELVPAIRGTAWQAYNAVSEYITHEAGRGADTRLSSQWVGPGAAQNKHALELALAM